MNLMSYDSAVFYEKSKEQGKGLTGSVIFFIIVIHHVYCLFSMLGVSKTEKLAYK